MTKHILCSRNFVHVDGAWMTAANAPIPIVADMNLSLVNLQTMFDSDSTMIELNSVEFTLTPESVAALMHTLKTFADAMPASGATPPPPSLLDVDDFGVRFKSGELGLSLRNGSDSLRYSIADSAVEFKKTINEWRMKSTIGVVSGRAVVSGAEETDVMNCSAEAFLKAHVCSRIAGSIDVASIDARITRDMLNFANVFLRRAARRVLLFRMSTPFERAERDVYQRTLRPLVGSVTGVRNRRFASGVLARRHRADVVQIVR